MADTALAGVGVLITRPRHQADELAATVAAHGGNAIVFPVTEIRPRAADQVTADSSGLSDPDIAVFVSPNAVRHGLAAAADATIVAVGPATAAAIEAAGTKVDIVPESGFDSEHLLAEPVFSDVASKVVRIIRGQSGRGLLAETLRSRGATVEYLAVYDRVMPAYSADEVEQLEAEWQGQRINAVTIMNVESLVNLIEILTPSCRKQLARTPLVTPAARVIQDAGDRLPGMPTILARGPQVRDIIDAIIALELQPPGQT